MANASNPHPLIAPYCSYMGSFSYYARDERARAADRKAPWDCVSANEPNGGYRLLRNHTAMSPFLAYLESRHPELYAEFIARRDAGEFKSVGV